MIRVFLVDGQTSYRESLAFVLDQQPDMRVVGQAGSVQDARQALPEADVTILDPDLPDGDGLFLVPDLQSLNRETMILVLSASNDRRDRAHAIEANAAAYLHKTTSVQNIINAVHVLARGDYLFSHAEIVELLRFANEERERIRSTQQILERLTPRERDVLEALADGLSDRDIAARLNIGMETVRSHMVHILAKLGVDSRLQAVVFALRNGFVSPNGSGSNETKLSDRR